MTIFYPLRYMRFVIRLLHLLSLTDIDYKPFESSLFSFSNLQCCHHSISLRTRISNYHEIISLRHFPFGNPDVVLSVFFQLFHFHQFLYYFMFSIQQISMVFLTIFFLTSFFNTSFHSCAFLLPVILNCFHAILFLILCNY